MTARFLVARRRTFITAALAVVVALPALAVGASAAELGGKFHVGHLGIRGMRINKEEDRVNVSIEGLNEHDAMAAAFLQGADTEQIHQTRDRIRNLHQALLSRSQAAAAKAPGAPAPAAPQVVSAAIKRRRR